MKNTSTSIAVIGLGRIGLPSALLAAEHHETVFGVDHHAEYIESLKKGEIPFLEKGLPALLAKSKPTFTTQIPVADIYILAIPTLTSAGVFSHKPVEKMLETVRKMSPNALIIIESTLPLGAIEALDNSAVYCPERVAPGSVFDELSTVQRCIASNDSMALERAASFYKSLGIRTLETTPSIAETVKLSENAFRDANIAFANYLSEVCKENDTDIREVIAIANSHPRVNILNPSLGAGGACLAPSTRTLGRSPLQSAIREINERQIHRILDELQQRKMTSVALWGVSYKANCDDVRYSKAIDLKTLLEANHIEVRVWDPVAKVGDFIASLESEVIVFGTPHDVFADDSLPQKTRKNSQIKYLIDIVDAIDIRVWNNAGFSCIRA